MTTVHTVPVADLVAHITDGDGCPCGPTTVPIELEDGAMAWNVIHHALDGREHGEPDHDHAACPLCSGGEV